MKKYYMLIFIIIIILAVTGIFWWNNSKSPSINIPIVRTVTNSTGTEGWKLYRNEELGFQLEYPGEWFLYDQITWEEDSVKSKCPGIEDIHNSFILSSKELGTCIGFAGDILLKGDLNIHVYDQYLVFFDKPSFFTGDPIKLQRIKIDGEEALKDIFTAQSELPRSESVQIFFNHDNKAYKIEFRQDDLNGNYDPIFDRILSTFHFSK